MAPRTGAADLSIRRRLNLSTCTRAPRRALALSSAACTGLALASAAWSAPATDVEDELRLPQTALGWTQLEPCPDTRIVYVSSSRGDDAFDGLSEATPKRTLAAGKAQLRDRKPDWLLLARGDVWHEALGHWIKCGRSATEPVLVGSYGPSERRPVLLTGASDGVFALASGPSPSFVHDVAFVGLHFVADTYDGTNGAPSGLSWLIQSDNLLVEDCEFERYQINVSVPGFGGRKSDVVLRRNVITDAFATSGTVGHGIYLANCDGVLIEENLLDHNGWNESVPGAVPTIFRHSIYVQSGSGSCTDVVVRGNIIANSASHGLHLRSGGTCNDNLFLRNPIAISLGGGNEPDPGGVRAAAQGNVVLGGRDIDDQNLRGWGIDLANVSTGLVTDNVISVLGDASMPIAMDLYGNSNGIGVHDTLIARNLVWDWGGPLCVHGDASQITGIALLDNAFNDGLAGNELVAHRDASSTAGMSSSGNRFVTEAPPAQWMSTGTTMRSLQDWKRLVHDSTSTTLPLGAYPDPGRTLAQYDATIAGPGTYAGFLREARKQTRGSWRQEYTAAAVIAYVREGFGLGPR